MLKFVNENSKLSPKKHYAIIDRDGTIIVDKHYLSSPDGVEFLPGAIDALKLLIANDIGLIVVSNQSGIGRGYFTEEDANAVNQKMLNMLERQGVVIDAVYCCPHVSENNCDCRKPESGMVIAAKADFGFDFANCVVIGDKFSDVNLGKKIGSLSVLVRTGKGADEERKSGVNPDFVCDDLFAATRMFLNNLGMD
ncbi:MAG: HAD family hydrolase [Alphaproteobacteria bacterium]|nr:HAD family hydrolase [Alphaproteobacteria bacterium]